MSSRSKVKNTRNLSHLFSSLSPPKWRKKNPDEVPRNPLSKEPAIPKQLQSHRAKWVPKRSQDSDLNSSRNSDSQNSLSSSSQTSDSKTISKSSLDSQINQRPGCSHCGGAHLTKNHSKKTGTKGNRFGLQRKSGTRQAKWRRAKSESDKKWIPKLSKFSKVTSSSEQSMVEIRPELNRENCPSIENAQEDGSAPSETNRPRVSIELDPNHVDERGEKPGFDYKRMRETIDLHHRGCELKYPIKCFFTNWFWDFCLLQSNNNTIDTNALKNFKDLCIANTSSFSLQVAFQLINLLKTNKALENVFEGYVTISIVNKGPINSELHDMRNDSKKRVDLKHPDQLLYLFDVTWESTFKVAGLTIDAGYYTWLFDGAEKSLFTVHDGLNGHDRQTQNLMVSAELLAQVCSNNVTGYSSDPVDLWNKINYAVSYNNSVNIDRYDFGRVEMDTALYCYYWNLALRQSRNLPFPTPPKTQDELPSDTVLVKLISLGLSFLRTRLNFPLPM
jgi:hypothetical protein